MESARLDEADIRQIQSRGLSVADVLNQLETLRRGVKPLVIDRPCTMGDGIEPIAPERMDEWAALHDAAAAAGRMMVFVPASGAATRMFRDWYRVLEAGGFASPEAAEEFAATLPEYAFYGDLEAVLRRDGTDADTLLREGKHADIIARILTPQGLNYGQLPKALLKFHADGGGGRTALEEHLAEAARYVSSSEGLCRVHFTVSGEYLEAVRNHLCEVGPRCEAELGVRFHVTFSTQSAATDTLAVDLENRPFRTPEGRLVFRPGGHGALLSNLDAVGGDLVFIKNIDNIVPDRLKAGTVRYKKVLGGILVALQEEVRRFQRRLAAGGYGERDLSAIARFCEEKLHVGFPADFARRPSADRAAFLQSKLARPLRVCGMVRNEGEPGGGPFWVLGDDGAPSPQIVEAFQVDADSDVQKARWAAATHFNPVDLVCGVRDASGNPYDLTRFVDRRTACITEKSEKGRDLKALELPGLWNGAMAFWNTVFIEVPIETFNPVKTVTDLLRPRHRRVP